MNRVRNTIFIIGLIAIIAAIGFVSLDRPGKVIKIETKNLQSIILVNKAGQGKAITKEEDIKAICGLFNATDMALIEGWVGYFERVGGSSYVFRFNYSSGKAEEIGYYDGSHLIKGAAAYSINSTEFEKFWDLDYPAQRWDFKENQFAQTE